MVDWNSLILLGDLNSPLVLKSTNGGGTPIPLALAPSSTCVPVGRASRRTLLGELDSMLNLTAVDIGVDRVDIPHLIARAWLHSPRVAAINLDRLVPKMGYLSRASSDYLSCLAILYFNQ